MKKFRYPLIFLLAIGVGTALAEQVVVQVQTLVIRSGKGSMYPPVGQANLNDKLDVIERQPDGWLRVRVSGGEGFVKETALSARDAGVLNSAAAGANSLTGNTSDVGASAAARGIRDDAITYASSKNLDVRPLEQMIQNRDHVAGQKWLQFAQQGQVGPFKK